MPWIHVAAATLLVLGTLALLAFLRTVESLDAGECADSPSVGAAVGWPPPRASAAARAGARHAAVESTPYRHAA